MRNCFLIFLIRVSIKDSSVNKLGSVCRRVYRIFSHAFFHHRRLFDEFEVFHTFSFFLIGMPLESIVIIIIIIINSFI